jgi:hypothetical protein
MRELPTMVKMRSDNMELSTETTGLMRGAMANLNVDDPEFVLKAALRNWIRYHPSIEVAQGLTTERELADELAIQTRVAPLQ